MLNDLSNYNGSTANFQVGLLPLAFNLGNVDYLFGNRDESNPESLLVGRAKRAGSNLLESLPSFLALAILSVVLAADNSDLMLYWLVLRVAYVVSYLVGVTYLRTILWLGSVACLGMMALALI
jgi:uncharacterized MAPEG superfamily protein